MTIQGNEGGAHSSLYESSLVEAHSPDESKAGYEFDEGVRRSRADVNSNEDVSGSETVLVDNYTHLIPLPSSSASASASSRSSIASHPERPLPDTLLGVGTIGGTSNPAALPESTTTTNNHSRQASLNTDSGRPVRDSSLDALEKVNGRDLISSRTTQTGSGYLRKPSQHTPDDLEITEIPEPPPSLSPSASKVHDKTAAQNASDGSHQGPALNHARYLKPSRLGSYKQTVQALSRHLPHLRHTLEKTRHHGINIKCYDYIDGLLVSGSFDTQITDFRGASKHTKNKLCQSLKDDIPEDVNLRFIVVEDLSVELIEILGSTFGISPEFFEEHLINSGWQDGIYQDREADTWITRGMEKNYMSIKWYRPTMPKSSWPSSAADRIKLLDPEYPLLPWTEADSVRGPNRAATIEIVEHKASLTTNILRQDWRLTTNMEDVAPLLSPSAWEERATVWSKHLGRCHVGGSFSFGCLASTAKSQTAVVLLLDPLPVLKDPGAAAALEARCNREIAKESAASGRIDLDAGAGNYINALKVLRGPTPGTFAKAPRKLLSRLMRFIAPSLSSPSAHDTCEFVKAEEGLPPVTEVSEQAVAEGSQAGITPDIEPVLDQRKPGRDISAVLGPSLGRLTGSVLAKLEAGDENSEPQIVDEEEGTDSTTLEPLFHCLFANVLPRGPPIDYSLLVSSDNIQHLADQLAGTNSTAVDLARWIEHREHRQLSRQTKFGPLDLLFGIISRDTLELIHLMDLALSEIGHDILDDSIIQQRLLHWRYLIEKFDLELRQLQKSLIKFAEFLSPSQIAKPSVQPSKSTESVPLHDLLKDNLKHLTELQQRTSRSYKSLMANMSIVESKRGIAEAESVTKLTELAFLFIPLTFSASIFSMQVRELDATRVSIAAFFILAIIITTSSYGLRLFIRSTSVIRLKKRCLDQVRVDAELTPGSPIPTRVFLIWLWHRIGLFAVFASLLVVLLIALLAVLWTRDINNGYKAILTVLILVFILVAVYYTRNLNVL